MLEKARYIVVEGPIGAGKTTLAKRLADRINAEVLLESELNLARFPLLHTLTDFLVYLLRSDEYGSFHYRAAYMLIRGKRAELVQVLAADPDAPGQHAALRELGMDADRPLEDLYFGVIENTLASPEAREKRDAKVRARRAEKLAAQRATEQVTA
mgnify:CR=1 FL=1